MNLAQARAMMKALAARRSIAGRTNTCGAGTWRVLELGHTESPLSAKASKTVARHASPASFAAEKHQSEGNSSRLLPFLACWRLWRKQHQRESAAAGPQTLLHYVLICAQPPQPGRLADELQGHPGYSALAQSLSSQCWGLVPGFHRLQFDEGRVQLTICVGGLKSMLRAQQFQADSLVLSGPARRLQNPPELARQSTLPECPEPPVMPVPRERQKELFSATSPENFDAAVHGWDRWTVSALNPLCRHGCVVVGTPANFGLMAWIAPNGPQTLSNHSGRNKTAPLVWQGHYAPPWPTRFTRKTLGPLPLAPMQTPGDCVVVGAGLAGASVAAAMARRGWRVTVLAADLSNGVAGLPIGLFAPQVSHDDNPRSRLVRAGLRMTLQALQNLQGRGLGEGQDWAASGVLERWLDADAAAPAIPPGPAQDWSQAAAQSGANPALWHLRGGWVKPQALIAAWLATPGVTARADARVRQIARHAGRWVLSDLAGKALASADLLVLAAAWQTQGLCDLATRALSSQSGPIMPNDQLGQTGQPVRPTAPAQSPSIPGSADEIWPQNLMQRVQGQLSWAQHPNPHSNPNRSPISSLVAKGADQQVITAGPLPASPINGNGHLIAQVPQGKHLFWFAGATYEPSQNTPLDAAEPGQVANAHADNFNKLKRLVPEAANTLRSQFESGQVKHWRGTRFIAPDRLPLVGALQAGSHPKLLVSTAFGSRGLTWAVLCAELLAARLHGEPLPIELDLAAKLDSMRFTQNSA